MNESIRGVVSAFASQKNISMPQAYKRLIVYGLAVSDVDSPMFRPDVDLNEDILKISRLDESEYELTIHECDIMKSFLIGRAEVIRRVAWLRALTRRPIAKPISCEKCKETMAGQIEPSALMYIAYELVWHMYIR